MILNILPDYLCRYFISYGSGEISVFPKLSTPKLFLHFRIFSKDHARADTLQHAYNFRYTIARWKRQKYVNMVLSYFHRIFRKSMVYGYFFEYLPYPFLYVSSKYPLPILWSPYQMVFRVCIRHARFFGSSCALHSTFPPAFGRKIFHPRPQDRVSSFKNFINRNHSKSMGLYVVRCEIPWIMKSAHCVPQNRRFFSCCRAGIRRTSLARRASDHLFIRIIFFVIFSFE